ncbi:YceI family protein [bacterium]|nr:YceI family protein [bacterium]
MKRIALFALVLPILATIAFKDAPKVYFQNQAGEITFFSIAPLEDITAVNKKSSALIKTEDGSIHVKVPIRAFEFKKDLMYQHFLEEKYMWVEKYPEAEFEGNITNLKEVDFDKNGSYNVNVKGDLTIRGVTKPYEVPGTVVVNGKNLKCETKFNVKLADHEVPIPSMVVDNIAEVVELTIKLDLNELEKKG